MIQTNLEKKESGTHVSVCLDVLNLETNRVKHYSEIKCLMSVLRAELKDFNMLRASGS